MKYILLLLLFYSEVQSDIFSQEFTLGAKPQAMGNSYTALSDDVYGVYFNPAGISEIAEIQGNLSYTRFFGIDEIITGNIGVIFPYKLNTFGFGFETFGIYGVYSENKTSIVLSRMIFKDLLFGIKINYFWIRYNEVMLNNPFINKVITSAGVDFGAIYIPHEKLRIGMTFKNINQPEFKFSTFSKKSLNRNYILGVAYIPFKTLTLATDCVIDETGRMLLKTGVEAVLVKLLSMRMGFNGRNLSFGFGFHLPILSFDFSALLHENLGMLYQFTVVLIR